MFIQKVGPNSLCYNIDWDELRQNGYDPDRIMQGDNMVFNVVNVLVSDYAGELGIEHASIHTKIHVTDMGLAVGFDITEYSEDMMPDYEYPKQKGFSEAVMDCRVCPGMEPGMETTDAECGTENGIQEYLSGLKHDLTSRLGEESARDFMEKMLGVDYDTLETDSEAEDFYTDAIVCTGFRDICAAADAAPVLLKALGKTDHASVLFSDKKTNMIVAAVAIMGAENQTVSAYECTACEYGKTWRMMENGKGRMESTSFLVHMKEHEAYIIDSMALETLGELA